MRFIDDMAWMDDFFFFYGRHPAHERDLSGGILSWSPGMFAGGFFNYEQGKKACGLLVDIRGYDLAVSTKKYSLIF